MNEMQYKDKYFTVTADPTQPLHLKFIGQSFLSEPSAVLQPLVESLIKHPKAESEGISLDFSESDYINSPTLRYVLRTIHTIHLLKIPITLYYSKESGKTMQSFTGMKILETDNPAIRIQAL